LRMDISLQYFRNFDFIGRTTFLSSKEKIVLAPA
jgi:hypothetical protein